jgi:hypothetical protein
MTRIQYPSSSDLTALRGLGDVRLRRTVELRDSDECDRWEEGGYGCTTFMSGMTPDDEVLRDWGADRPWSSLRIRYLEILMLCRDDSSGALIAAT